ncbi:hypothetical protein D9M71_485260 [compost metagenome]
MQHYHGLAHITAGLVDLLDGLAAIQALLVELLDDAKQAVDRLMQLQVFVRSALRQAQAVVDILHATFHEGHGLAGFALQAFDHFPDVLGGVGRALCQRTYFIGDHGKTAAMFTGASGLDGRVEREQVGLVGDVGDKAGEGADLDHALVQLLHAGRRTCHHIANRLGTRLHCFELLAGTQYYLVHGFFHLFGGQRGLLDFAQLTFDDDHHAVNRIGHFAGG